MNTISIVVAAKNEELNIKELINCISKQNYEKNNFELIIVNDGSADGTSGVTLNSHSLISSLKLLEISKEESSGKRNALSLGIKNSKYPFICITDADCRPQKNWLESFNHKFSEGYDFVFGIAPFYQEKNLANKISCYENFRNSLLAIAMTKLGLPYTAAARSFGFSKKAFEKVDGYKNTFDTLSGDDDLLLREAVKNKMKIGIVTDKNSFVYSKTKNTFKDYFRQRARHTKSSFHYLLKQKFVLALFHLLNLLFLFSPLLLFVNKIFIIPFIVKIVSDLIIGLTFQKKFGYRFSFFEIIYLQVLYELFLIIHFFNALFKKPKWK